MEQYYAELVLDRPVYRFLQLFFLSDSRAANLILISPILTTLAGTRFTLTYLRDKIDREHIPTYVITTEPKEEFHEEAVDVLRSSDFVEIRYNSSLHAKLYVCRYQDSGFALLGSGNLTRKSIDKNIEIGMIIHSRGRGRELFDELFNWGVIRLRTRSKRVKKMTYKRRL